MIRFLNEPPIEAGHPIPAPTEEMLERRRRFLRETAGAWTNEDGDRICRAIDEMFETSEPDGVSDDRG